MADNPAFNRFSNALRILLCIDRDELTAAGITLHDHNHNDNGWANFRRDPYRWFIQASDDDAARLWGIIEKRQSARVKV